MAVVWGTSAPMVWMFSSTEGSTTPRLHRRAVAVIDDRGYLVGTDDDDFPRPAGLDELHRDGERVDVILYGDYRQLRGCENSLAEEDVGECHDPALVIGQPASPNSTDISTIRPLLRDQFSMVCD
jgi:hypothetical protein